MRNSRPTMQSMHGFTIVELLIVIIVIAILATITIVAYNGITTDANASRAKGNAANVLKVASAYATDEANNGAFPTPAQLTGWAGGLARLPNGVSINSTVLITASNAADGKTVTYMNKGTTGACVAYWDAGAVSPGVVWIYAGNAATGGNAAPPTCV
jgi:type IV pilus assembly protein PilA